MTGNSENDDEYVERLLSLVNSRRKNENGAKNGDLVLTIEDLLPNRKCLNHLNIDQILGFYFLPIQIILTIKRRRRSSNFDLGYNQKYSGTLGYIEQSAEFKNKTEKMRTTNFPSEIILAKSMESENNLLAAFLNFANSGE